MNLGSGSNRYPFTHGIGEMAHDGGHLKKGVTGLRTGDVLDHAVPHAHDPEIHHQDPIFKRALFSVTGSVLQEVGEQLVITIEALMNLRKRSGLFFFEKVSLCFEEGELICGGNLSGVIARSPSAEYQDTRVAEPI